MVDTPRHRGLWIAGALATIATVALFAMLGGWALAIHLPGQHPQESFPDWYTDPFDTSWQLPLAPAGGAGPGRSMRRPVKVCGVHGEQAYLASLLCADEARTPPFVDPFEVMDATRETQQRAFRARAVDRYEVTCPGGVQDVFLSPYHCGEEEEAGRVPEGFVPRFPAGGS